MQSASTDGRGASGVSGAGPEPAPIPIAAAGDIHCRPAIADEIRARFEGIASEVDLILLAGDLTTHGEVEEAEVLADACRSLETPVLAVLGNHDYHGGKHHEVEGILDGGGISILDRSWTTLEVRGIEVGVVGTKGFVGGFAGTSHLPDFGEPLLRQVYAETSAEVDALEEGLREVSMCPIRIVLLHYSPIAETLDGEPPGIWAFLGTDRLAAPIREHEPDLVLHGHAHAGRFQGQLGGIAVYNVSIPVMERDFWVFELTPARRPVAPIH